VIAEPATGPPRLGVVTDRARSAARTRADILQAAREQFARHGYDRTTTRSVAGAVGVDAALVKRYFGSKAELFAEVARLGVNFPDLTGMQSAEIAGALVDTFYALYEPDGPLLALIRAATTSPEAATALRSVLMEKATPALATAAVDQPGVRAMLVGSQLLGFAFVRSVLEATAATAMDRDDVERWLGPVLVHYLTAADPGDAL
jgi:AcrR family transcriptional regulator